MSLKTKVMVWEEWGKASFARSVLEKKPVLLALNFDELLTQPEIKAVIRGRFIPIRLEREDRPDIYHRYGAAGHALLMLSSHGEVLAEAAFAPAQALAKRLTRLADSYAPAAPARKPQAKPVWTGAVGVAVLSSLDPEGPLKILASLKSRRAALHEVPGALDLLLYAAAEWRDKEALRRLIQELSALVENGCSDKSLVFNAALARFFWEAYAFTRIELFQDAGRKVAGFLLDELHEPDKGVFKSAPGKPVYYTDANAMAAVALLRAAPFWEQRRCRAAADKVLRFLEEEMYDPLLGMIHKRSPGGPLVYGLLGDNAWTVLAFTDSFQINGKKEHREFADAIIRFLFQELWERERGGFLDRIVQADDVEALKSPAFASLEHNAVACEGLWRLHHLKGNPNYGRWLEWALKSLSSLAPVGHALVPLARVQDMLARGRMDLELVGRLGDAATDALLCSVHRHYVPRKIISFIDPDDQDYILAHKLKASSYPRLFGCVDLKPKIDADSPDRVSGLLDLLEQPRV